MSFGKPDNPALINEFVGVLQANKKPFLIRCYLHYNDSMSDLTGQGTFPKDFLQYSSNGKQIDLVLSYNSKSGDVAGWVDFVRKAVQSYGSKVAMLQVTEESNLNVSPVLDGSFPNVREALVQGVIAAKAESIRNGHDNLQIGFSAVPNFESDFGDEFFKAIGMLGGDRFVRSLDYVGLDIYPDVFYPLPSLGLPGDIRHFIEGSLRSFRETSLPAIGIPATVPIHVAENGWPTGPERSYGQQAEAIESIIRTINDYRGNYNVTHYELFDLRDADSSNPGMFSQFGILHDDYTPKPAFEVYRKLVEELSTD
jgi:hypothetical protein